MNISKRIGSLNVKWKLLLMVVVALTGFVGDAVYMYSLMAKVSVNGPIDKEMEMNSDLVSDILPPPEYIIEAYLTTLQMRNENNLESLEKLINKFEVLKKDYIGRHEFWKQELPNGELKTAMTEKSYEPAMVFLDIVEKQYIPAVRSHNATKIDALINGRLKDVYEKHRAAIDKTVKLAEAESSLIKKSVDKTIRWTQISSIFFALIILGVVISFAFYIQADITERKRAEEELRMHRDHLEELVKEQTAELTRSNTELGQFVYIASHDLQEPLRMVASYLQLVDKRYKEKLDDDAREFIGFAVDGAKRMQLLINDLLSYSRVGTKGQPFQPVDCEQALQMAMRNLQVAIRESGAQITHDPLPAVMGDATQLEQLFQNLIGNALKFRRDEPSKIHVGAEQKNGCWYLSVQDNGIGIEAQYFDRIFIVFKRLHGRNVYPGTGIGLAICKKIVERHGGAIWVESEVGKGSTFRFTIPEKAGETA
jgi:signal transduction histidine kinase